MQQLLAVATLLASACGGSSTPAPAPAPSARPVPSAPVSQPTPVAAQPALSNPNKQPPQLGPVKALVPPAVVERRLSNGLRVLVVEQHELPLADVLLLVKSGSETDPLGKEGLGTLAVSMLD